MTYPVRLTARELEAVLWATGNFEGGDAGDCASQQRYAAIRSAFPKIRTAYQVAVKGEGEPEVDEL